LVEPAGPIAAADVAALSAAWVLPASRAGDRGFVAETWHWRLVFLGLLPLIAIAGRSPPARSARSPPIR
jgi:hypothetical protein